MAQDDKDKPWISNYPPLQEWLNAHEARCDWQIPYGNKNKPAMYVEQWRTRTGREFIIHAYPVLAQGVNRDTLTRH